MMVDAVLFDLGCVRPPLFAFPDASGLAPLTLPDEFLRWQSNQPQAELPADTVRRFETVMSAEPQFSPSVAESLMAHMRSGSPAVEGPEVKSPKVKNPTGEGLKIQSPKPEVASVANQLPVASVERTRPAEPTQATEKAPAEPVERPLVVPVATSVHEGSEIRLADGKPVDVAPVSVDKPLASAVEVPKVATVERPVAVDKPTVAPVEPSVRVVVGEPDVVLANTTIPPDPEVRPVEEKLVVASLEQSKVVAVEPPKVVMPEMPVAVAPQAAPTVAPGVLENPDGPVKEEGHPVAANSIPVKPDAPAIRPRVMVEVPVAVEKPFVAPSGNTPIQVVVTTPAEPGVIIEKTPVVPAERPAAAKVSSPAVATVDKPEEKAVAAAAHVVVAPAAVEASAPQVLQAAPEVAVLSAASARTEALVETVNQIVEAVVGQILVTPGITHGECEIKIMLKPTVLDGSEVAMSARDGTLTVNITPATQEASVAAAAALPRLEIALAEHAPAFHHVSVALQLKKGNRNEAV